MPTRQADWIKGVTMKTKSLIQPQVYLYENGWRIESHGHPSGTNFWIAEKVDEQFSFDHPLSKTRIFRDKQSAVNYIGRKINE